MKNSYFIIGFAGVVLFLLGFYFFGEIPTGNFVSPIVEKYSFEEIPPSFELKKGETVEIDIDFGEEYIFSDDSDFFDIDPNTGVIYFVPENSGNFSVVIIALKGLDDIHTKLIDFEVIE